MKKLLTYNQFLLENTPIYSFDGVSLNVGDPIISDDGYTGIIISKEIVNGTVQFRDNKGVIHIQESSRVVCESLQWWQIAKGILAIDSIKVGNTFVGGGLNLASHLFTNWRKSINSKLESLKKDSNYPKYRELSNSISAKLNIDQKLNSLLGDLQKYPYTDPTFVMSSRSKKKIEQSNAERRKIMKSIANEVKDILTKEESDFFMEINNILKNYPLGDDGGKKLEEDINDPNRIVGTGTYTSTHSDPNVLTGGSHNSTDSASNGSYPVYIS